MTAASARAQKAAQSLITVAWVAAPDWTATDRQRRVARGSILVLAGGLGTLDVLRQRADARRSEAEQAGREETDLAKEGPDAEELPAYLRWAVPVGLGASYLLAFVAVSGAAEQVNGRFAAALRRRGVRRPHTLVALGWAVVSVGRNLGERRTPTAAEDR